MTRFFVRTAGENVQVDSELPWVESLLREAAAGQVGDFPFRRLSLQLRVEADPAAFPTDGWEPLTRGAFRQDSAVVLQDAGSTGFDLLATFSVEGPQFKARWRPRLRNRIAALLLPGRFQLLARSVLLHYPVLWVASLHGRAPLHISAYEQRHARPVLAGPGGVGKSTLVRQELARGAVATADNLAVSDGTRVYGLLEPLRHEGGQGRRMPHGRREDPVANWMPTITPDRVVVLRRGMGPRVQVAPCTPAVAERALISGTYMAGELRRYWAFAATLAAGLGVGPVHPPVEAVAHRLAAGLPCWEMVLAREPIGRLAEVMSLSEATA